jgi:hypothetical protein
MYRHRLNKRRATHLVPQLLVVRVMYSGVAALDYCHYIDMSIPSLHFNTNREGSLRPTSDRKEHYDDEPQ